MLLPALSLSLKSHELYNNRTEKSAEEGRTMSIPTLPNSYLENKCRKRGNYSWLACSLLYSSVEYRK